MKKTLLALLSLFLLLGSFQACSRPREETKELWVLTDLGKAFYIDGQIGGAETLGQEELDSLVEYYGGLGIPVRVEVLPKEDADLHSRLTRIRTEMLTGGGPDVFLLSCDELGIYSDQERLFLSVDNAMSKKLFLPLDKYIENARFMEWDKLNQTVMKAGRTGEGQMVLPMFHSILYGTGETARSDALYDGQFSRFMFEKLFDYDSESILISEEELAAYVKSALEEAKGHGGDPAYSKTMTELEGLHIPSEEYAAETWFPLRNVNGGVTSQVVSYAAINRNTAHPDEAFSLVDMLMSRRFLSLSPFWNESRILAAQPTNLFDKLKGFYGVPVYDDFFDEGAILIGALKIPEPRLSAYHEGLDSITHVNFPSNADDELRAMFEECLKATNESEIGKAVHKHYVTMQMVLAES